MPHVGAPGTKDSPAASPRRRRFSLRDRLRLPFFARYTFHWHSRAEALMGVYQSLFDLRGFVARKTLGASDTEVALITSIPNIAQMFAIVWRTLLSRLDRRRAIVWVGIGGKGLLILAALLTQSWAFVLLCCVVALVDSAYVPLRNLLFQSNYSSGIRGALFSMAYSITITVTLVTSLAAASFLDGSASAYRWLYPIAGLAGIAVHLLYARARLRNHSRHVVDRVTEGSLVRLAVRAVVEPIRLTRSILKGDARFRAFESSFFLYGMTYMMNDVLAVFLATDSLHASYTQISLGQTVIPLVTMIFCLPLWGRFLDRTGPLRVSSVAFLGVGAWTLGLAATTTIPLYYASGVLRGVAMAGVQVVWNLGPLHFAPRGRSSDYMGVHVALVGLRGSLGPIVAVLLRQVLGVHVALAIAALFAISAATLARRAALRSVERAAGPAE